MRLQNKITRSLLSSAAIALGTMGLALAFSTGLRAGTNIVTSQGTPVRWPSGAGLRFTINPAGVPGFTGELDRLVVAGAVRDAFRAWTQTSSAAIQFTDLGLNTDADPPAGSDAISHVSFTPTATSFPPGVLAITNTRFLINNGQIVDADISYNPTPANGLPFSPVAAPNTIDLVSVGVHEIGHLLGLDHSGIASAIMKASVTQVGSVASRQLSSDDAITASVLYPLQTFAPSTGRISGSVLNSTGGIVRSAHVVAMSSPAGVPVASQLSGADGSYRLDGLPPGNYQVLVEPLDGPATLSQQIGRAHV